MKPTTSVTLISTTALISVAFALSPALAADTIYECDAVGDGNTVVTIPGNNHRIAWAQYTLDSEYGGASQGPTRLELHDGDQYIAKGLIFSLHGNHAQLDDIHGDIVVNCNRVNAGQNHASGSVGGNETIYNGVPARSLGGKVRAGPGTNFQQIGSLGEGERVSIVANTGVKYDGLDWFEIRFNGKRGYQWGGIMCSQDSRLPGIYQQCSGYSQSSPTQSSANGNAWMAFAIGHDGRLGHGSGQTREDARRFAFQYCGDASCQIEDETQAQCHAAAETPGGFWFGAANSKRQAENYALNFCSQAGASCIIRYSFCR